MKWDAASIAAPAHGVMIFDWIQRGQLQVEPLISRRLLPIEIKTAYAGLLHQPETFTGVAPVWK